MAAETVKDFLETGSIRNSVNFPQTVSSEVLLLTRGATCARHDCGVVSLALGIEPGDLLLLLGDAPVSRCWTASRATSAAACAS